VFTPDCATAGCHSAGSTAGGLNLEDAASYAMLVDVPSNGDPAIDRVEPGVSDGSYLIQKLEGTAGGQQMPPGAPLPQAEIDVIRQWISDGAIDDRVVVLAPINVMSISPAPNAALTALPANIVAGFSRDLNQTTLDATTFLLTASGGDGTFVDNNEVVINGVVSVGGNPASAMMDLTGVQLNDDTYRISLLGNATDTILDLDGNMLDGEYLGALPSGNGIAGGDFNVQFTLTIPVVIGPTLPQIQAIVFTPKCAVCHTGVGAVLPGVMNLTSEAASRAALVDVPSIQSALDRVEPGQPNNSYLVHKIDGTAVSQMPPPNGQLPQVEIDAIIQWIADGAP